ncbi:MAG: tetratricopeptide repeat protein [Pseudomonadales bacterium]|nr:tetratricopeptide repeat protein [Pseudomonadales bacterium]
MSFSKLKLIGLLVFIGFITYLSSLNNKFVWDDEQFIYNNAYVKNFEIGKIFTENTIAGAGEISSYYRPLTTLSFAMDYQLWELNPLGFHITNTFLHILSGIILFLFLINLSISKIKSFWISTIFLIHPLQTEAVVYANSRGDSMYVFWSLLGLFAFSMLCLKKYPKFQIYDLSLKLGKVQLLILTVISYLLSILGKEIGIASLGLFFLTFIYINRNIFLFHTKNISNELKKIGIQSSTLLLLSIIATVYLIFRKFILNISTSVNFYNPNSPYGSSLFVRLHTFSKALWTYFKLIIYPTNLHMERTLDIITDSYSIWLFASIFLFVIVFIVGYFELIKKHTALIWFGFLWFIIMLVPVSGIIPINGLIYEHWLYMPIIGFIIFTIGIIAFVFDNKLNKIIKYSLPILIIIYIGLTIKQNYIWADPIRFYQYTLNYVQTARLSNNLAMAYAQSGQNQLAVETYKKAIELSNYYPQTHHNLGNTYLAMNEIELAEDSFKSAIRMNNGFFPSYGPLINILIDKEQYDEALPLINQLYKQKPNDFQTGLIYLNALYKTNKLKDAEEQLQNLKDRFGKNIRANDLIDKVVNDYTQK